MGARGGFDPARNELILAAQTGDNLAIGRLLASCQTDIRRYARHHCMASEIDDAVQETLLVVARKVSGLKTAAAFTGCLFTVIRRECRRLSRAMLGRPIEPLDAVEQRIAEMPDETLRLDVAAALDSLPAHYLEVILLLDFEELTIAEIRRHNDGRTRPSQHGSTAHRPADTPG